MANMNISHLADSQDALFEYTRCMISTLREGPAMKKAAMRRMLVDLVVRKSAEQNQDLTVEEANWLIDSTMAGEFTDEDLADCIGEAAVPTWNRIIALIS